MVLPMIVASKHSAAVTAACRTIENAEEVPSLAELAKAADMSPFHFQRVFKQITGVTPKAYEVAHRAGRVRDYLRKSSHRH